jgi:hypothetical protein
MKLMQTNTVIKACNFVLRLTDIQSSGRNMYWCMINRFFILSKENPAAGKQKSRGFILAICINANKKAVNKYQCNELRIGLTSFDSREKPRVAQAQARNKKDAALKLVKSAKFVNISLYQM